MTDFTVTTGDLVAFAQCALNLVGHPTHGPRRATTREAGGTSDTARRWWHWGSKATP